MFTSRHPTRLVASSTVLLAVSACSSGGGAAPPPTTVVPPPIVDPGSADMLEYSVLTTRTLDADGDMVGLDAYDLIRDFGGPNPIEAPDLYPINHPDDRQRNEIKTYNRSEEAVKGYENETFIFRWKFRINDGMEVSTRFTHFFQLKAVGGPDSQPILTISGAERSGSDGIEVRHSPLQDHTVLERTDWSDVTGEWLDAYCRVTFSDSGDLRLIVTRMSDDAVIFDIDETGLDLWRGEDPSHFVRPKWGIYRSILDLDNLRPDEEIVRFANISISEVMPSS